MLHTKRDTTREGEGKGVLSVCYLLLTTDYAALSLCSALAVSLSLLYNNGSLADGKRDKSVDVDEDD